MSEPGSEILDDEEYGFEPQTEPSLFDSTTEQRYVDSDVLVEPPISLGSSNESKPSEIVKEISSVDEGLNFFNSLEMQESEKHPEMKTWISPDNFHQLRLENGEVIDVTQAKLIAGDIEGYEKSLAENEKLLEGVVLLLINPLSSINTSTEEVKGNYDISTEKVFGTIKFVDSVTGDLKFIVYETGTSIQETSTARDGDTTENVDGTDETTFSVPLDLSPYFQPSIQNTFEKTTFVENNVLTYSSENKTLKSVFNITSSTSETPAQISTQRSVQKQPIDFFGITVKVAEKSLPNNVIITTPAFYEPSDSANYLIISDPNERQNIATAIVRDRQIVGQGLSEPFVSSSTAESTPQTSTVQEAVDSFTVNNVPVIETVGRDYGEIFHSGITISIDTTNFKTLEQGTITNKAIEFTNAFENNKETDTSTTVFMQEIAPPFEGSIEIPNNTNILTNVDTGITLALLNIGEIATAEQKEEFLLPSISLESQLLNKTTQTELQQTSVAEKPAIELKENLITSDQGISISTKKTESEITLLPLAVTIPEARGSALPDETKQTQMLKELFSITSTDGITLQRGTEIQTAVQEKDIVVLELQLLSNIDTQSITNTNTQPVTKTVDKNAHDRVLINKKEISSINVSVARHKDISFNSISNKEVSGIVKVDTSVVIAKATSTRTQRVILTNAPERVAPKIQPREIRNESATVEKITIEQKRTGAEQLTRTFRPAEPSSRTLRPAKIQSRPATILYRPEPKLGVSEVASKINYEPAQKPATPYENKPPIPLSTVRLNRTGISTNGQKSSTNDDSAAIEQLPQRAFARAA